jgi:hypothetical protein
MTALALIIIAACLVLTFYIYFVVGIALWLSEVADTFWYGSGPWVGALFVVALAVVPIARLVEVVT